MTGEGRVMSKDSWNGIPRKKIPWFPTIDYEKCHGCGKCLDYCKLGTFESQEESGKQMILLKNPYNCVVLCAGCDSICPEGAIKHPSKRETQKTIRNLRQKFTLRSAQKESRVNS